MIVRKLLPAVVFVIIFVAHALYVSSHTTTPPSGWIDFNVDADSTGWLGLSAYWRGQDYFLGFSYALGAAFAIWALSRSIFLSQNRALAAGAAVGGATFVGLLMAGSCFLIGCCGSPMLAVYLSLFGAKALGLGKPLTALIALTSVSCGYWCLSRRLARGKDCVDACCTPPATDRIDRSEVATRVR